MRLRGVKTVLFGKSNPEKETAIMLGEPNKAIYTMVVPFLISLIVGQVNMLADIGWCSGLGSHAVSAIQAVNPLFWVIFDVGLGIGLGSNVLISRRIGAGDYDGAKSIITQGTVLAVAIALILVFPLYLLIDPMMVWMGAEEISDLGVAYLAPILMCNIFQVLTPTLAGFLRGEGAAKKSNYAMIIGTSLNIVLDPILIYGLDMGVVGAGTATALATTVSSVIMIYLYRTKRTTIPMTFKGYRFNRKDASEIMYIGAPKMAEMFLMDLLDAINRVFLIECAGVDAMVLFSVPFRIVMFAVMLPNAFGMSLTPVASANLGAKKPENSVKAYRTCLKATGMISAAMIVIYMIFASILVVPFTMSESMIVMRPELGTLLRIECFMIPALSLSFVCGAMLQAMRKPMVAMVLTFTRTGLTTLFFALLMETSITYMCAGMVMANVIGGLLAFYTTRLKIRELGVVHHATA